MTNWVKVYNSLPSHPKVLVAGDRAGWLFVCGLCYSNEHLTDGFIARHVLPAAAPGVKSPETQARALVVAGLWHEVDGGWQIHDYDEVQSSAEEVRSRRARDAQRKADNRAASNGSPRGQNVDSARTPLGVLGVDEIRGDETRGEDKTPTPSLRSDVAECFAYWQQKCDHGQAKLIAVRRRAIEARLKEGYTLEQIRQAIDGAARAPFINDAGKRFDDIELICRNGSKLESFIDRAAARPISNGTSDLDRKRIESMNRLRAERGVA